MTTKNENNGFRAQDSGKNEMRAEAGVSRDTGSRRPTSSGRSSHPEKSSKAAPAQVIDETTFKGLCQTCKTRLGCVFPRDPRVPVVFCDEFCGLEHGDCYTQALSPSTWNGPAKAQATFNPNMKGLCKTCDLAEGCQFPKLAGGVWHCEEYK